MPKTPSKTCHQCKKTYDNAYLYFWKDARISTGYQASCIPCKTKGQRTSRVHMRDSSVVIKTKPSLPSKKPSNRSTLEGFFIAPKKQKTPKKKKSVKDNHQQPTLFATPPKKKKQQEKGMKECSFCKKVFPETTKYFTPNGKKGKLSFEGIKLHSTCRSCRNVQSQIHRKNNPNLRVFQTKRHKAKYHGIEFNLGERGSSGEKAWIAKMEKTTSCVDCGQEISAYAPKESNGAPRKNSMSFDKINPNIGYVEGNTRLVCYECNTRKSTSPVDEWMGQLEVRIRKGMIQEIDPDLVRYIERENSLEKYFE